MGFARIICATNAKLAKNEEYYDENLINGTIDFTKLV